MRTLLDGSTFRLRCRGSIVAEVIRIPQRYQRGCGLQQRARVKVVQIRSLPSD